MKHSWLNKVQLYFQLDEDIQMRNFENFIASSVENDTIEMKEKMTQTVVLVDRQLIRQALTSQGTTFLCYR